MNKQNNGYELDYRQAVSTFIPLSLIRPTLAATFLEDRVLVAFNDFLNPSHLIRLYQKTFLTEKSTDSAWIMGNISNIVRDLNCSADEYQKVTNIDWHPPGSAMVFPLHGLGQEMHFNFVGHIGEFHYYETHIQADTSRHVLGNRMLTYLASINDIADTHCMFGLIFKTIKSEQRLSVKIVDGIENTFNLFLKKLQVTVNTVLGGFRNDSEDSDCLLYNIGDAKDKKKLKPGYSHMETRINDRRSVTPVIKFDTWIGDKNETIEVKVSLSLEHNTCGKERGLAQVLGTEAMNTFLLNIQQLERYFVKGN